MSNVATYVRSNEKSLVQCSPSVKYGGNQIMSLENGKITAHRIVVNAVKSENLV